MMVDYNRLLKMEDARIGYGPSQFLWGKVVIYYIKHQYGYKLNSNQEQFR